MSSAPETQRVFTRNDLFVTTGSVLYVPVDLSVVLFVHLLVESQTFTSMFLPYDWIADATKGKHSEPMDLCHQGSTNELSLPYFSLAHRLARFRTPPNCESEQGLGFTERQFWVGGQQQTPQHTNTVLLGFPQG